MKILAIETSCDETAVALLEAHGGHSSLSFRTIADALQSQAQDHAPYGGVYPTLAKREHQRNLIPILNEVLERAGVKKTKPRSPLAQEKVIAKVLNRESDLHTMFCNYIPSVETPDIDIIAVTNGPGLEPALWVGINFAKALSLAWNKPVIPVNHMEGHLLSVLADEEESSSLSFPALALLVSGGHTELVLANDYTDYTILGETRDDAVGEAFDKVARMLGLPYPGGPHIGQLAKKHRESCPQSNIFDFPRPMINSHDFDFSYSGLKTAVLYATRGRQLSDTEKMVVAREFEDVALEVLVAKAEKAIETHMPKTFIVAGGVAASTYLRELIQNMMYRYPEIDLKFSQKGLSTDNAVMIGVAGYLEALSHIPEPSASLSISAEGNLRL